MVESWNLLSGGNISKSVLSDWANKEKFVCQVDNSEDAKLIASAPDMLNALEGVMASLRKIRDESPVDWDNLMDIEHAHELMTAWDECKLAIAQAKL